MTTYACREMALFEKKHVDHGESCLGIDISGNDGVWEETFLCYGAVNTSSFQGNHSAWVR
jgi:hypothetical protein